MSSEHIVIEIADTLLHNKTITQLDLSGNNIANKKWFQLDTFIVTKENPKLPSIATSLQHNKMQANRNGQGADGELARVKFAMDNVKKGRWTSRRVWKRVVLTNQAKIAAKTARALEHDRIHTEATYIKDKLEAYLNLMRLYLDEQPCKQYLHALAAAITQYLHNLPKVSAVMAAIQAAADKTAAENTAHSTHPASHSFTAADGRVYSPDTLNNSLVHGSGVEARSAVGQHQTIQRLWWRRHPRHCLDPAAVVWEAMVVGEDW